MKKRILSFILCLAMAASVFPVSVLANETQSEEVTGKIKATLRFDYPQLVSDVLDRNISVTMYDRNGNSIGEIPFEGDVTGEISERTAVLKKNTEGGELTDESGEIGYFDVEVSDLPLGNYSFGFKGDGYAAYKTPVIKLEDFSQQIIIGTGDSTFSIGDVDKSGKVDARDRNLMTGALGKTDAESIKVYDLNGDNKIDIVDLAYVNHEIVSEGGAQIFDTVLIAQKAVKTDAITEAVNVQGEVSNIFKENNEEAVTIKAKANKDLSIPIELNKPMEMEQIEVVTPDGVGALTEGEATVVYYDENGVECEDEIYFDASAPEEVHFLGEDEKNIRSVVISLGKRVAVKKITINVIKVEGQDGKPSYAVVQEVKFLKDIVPENPAMQSLCVRNVTAKPLNESVRLTWDEFPNISGYTVYYRMENENSERQITVDINSAVVSGLKNLKTYYFTVVPISDGWQGKRSETVSAIPQPNSRPLKPDMITVTPMDKALSLSWKRTENATYYRVFYKKASDTAYVEITEGKITSPKAVIGGLENKTVYHLYVVAGNNIGEGPKSDITEGIPDKLEIEAPKIPTLHMIDRSNIENVQMQNKNNVLASEYPNNDFNVMNVADGDYGTHWTARVFWESNQFTFTFKEAKEMNYMVYVPRLDGKYRKSLEKYSITVWDEYGNQKNLVSGKKIAINSTTSGYMILPFEKTKVKKLAVSLSQWAGSPTGVSLAEAVFYESDDLEAQVRGLFANDIYTELSDEAKTDKTAARKKIEDLRAQANDANGYYVDKDILLDELNLAEKLINEDNSALGIVKEGVQSRSTGADSSKYKQSGSSLQPLGAVAYSTAYAERNKKSETTVTIYAHIPEGEKVSVVPTQYYAEANAWQGAEIPLQSGRNVIDIPQMGTQTSERGGALYIRYSGSKADEISLQVRRGAIPIPVLELSDWYKISEAERKERIGKYVDALESHTKNNPMNQTGIHNSTEISMPNVLLSVAAAPVYNSIRPTGSDKAAAVEKLYNSVLAWEEFMSVANTTQGIDNTLDKSDMQSRQNIRYMRMFAKAFMYAAGNHIGIGYGSVAGTVSGKPVSMMGENAKSNNLFGWGLAHEVGHNMDKLGKAEITNNIYSLMIQTYDGKQNTLPSRLEKSNKYAGIYKKVAEGRPGMSNDVFVQLGMYWQLHLAYDDGDNPLAFYNSLFKEWKSGSVSAPSSDEKFALAAAKTANRDLTEFFEKWGMNLSSSTKAALKAYPAETRKLQYLNDASRRYRLSGGAKGDGITKASAALDSKNEKQVNLSFSTSAEETSVLGFEISRNGKTIAFVSCNGGAKSGTYTDIIGSANNLAFNYTVKAVDMLGNVIGDTADAGQVRISYVKTVDPSNYTMTRNGDNSITVDMNRPMAVSGIKVSNAPAAGNYTVSIKRGDEITVAKNGNFAKNETPTAGYYVAYFNKPKASSDDTRIWTYDAEKITIEGMPESASVEFISYAGDNVEFTSDAAVGRLKDDYVYDDGDGGKEVIKAGTLVVTGTYRGDPVYNTIQINGKFVSTDSETNEQTVIERAIDGYGLLFAEIPEDGEVSDISDGIFIFVPNVQKEAELQGEVHDCSAVNLLPAQIKAELYRTDVADSTESKRLTSDTVWIESPSDDSMPAIILE